MEYEDEKMILKQSQESFARIRRLLQSHVRYNRCHHLYTSHNLYKDLTVDDFKNLYKSFDYKATYPIPINTIPDDTNHNYVHEIVTKKCEWNMRIRLFTTRYRRLNSRRKLASIPPSLSNTVVPRYLINFVKLLQKDPDIHFDSDHNWYFVGNGNLCTTFIDDTLYLIKSVNATLYIQKYEETYNDVIDFSYTCDNKQVILETICATLSDQSIFIGIRQRLVVYLFRLIKTENKLELNLVKTLISHIPFVSIVMDNTTNVIFYSFADGSVNYIELNTDNTSEILKLYENQETINLWSSINVLDDNSIIITDKANISILDRRDGKITKINEFARMDCELLFVTNLSSRSRDLIYSTTTHNVLLFDLRCINDKNDLIKKWTHGLKNNPTFIKNTNINNDELLYISSYDYNDGLFIQNRKCSKEDDSVETQQLVLPWKPCSIEATVQNLQLQGHYLDPRIDLRQRIKSPKIGIEFPPGDKKHLLILNCRGDTFSQTVYNSSEESVDSNLHDCFSPWCERLKCEKRFIAGSVVSMANGYYSAKFTTNRLNKNSESSDVKVNGKRKIWRDCIEQFSKCTDLCAQELLSVWEVDIQENDDLEVKPTDTSFNKINEWLDKNDQHI